MGGVNWGIITNQPGSGSGGGDASAFVNSFERQQQLAEQRRQFDLNYNLNAQTKDLAERQFERQGKQWNDEFGLRKSADQRQAETHGFDVADRKAKQDEQSLAVFSDLYDAASQAKTPEERNRLLSTVKKMMPSFDPTPWTTDDGWNFGVQRLKKIVDESARKREAQAAATDKTRAEAAEKSAQGRLYDSQAANLDQHWKESPTNPGMLYNQKTGEWKAMGPGGGNGNRALFDKKFAEKAPEFYQKAAGDYATASDTFGITKDLQVLAPHIYSGSMAGAQTEVAKVFNKYVGTNFQGVGPTELFHSLAQKFVGAEGQKYKPLSNSDVAFIEKALPTIGKDPQSLPHIIGAMQTVAARDMLAKQLEMEAYRNGQPPDYVAIKKQLDAQVPSYVERAFGQQQPQGAQQSGLPPRGAQPGMAPPAPVAPAAPAPQAAPRAAAPGTVIPHGQPLPPNMTFDWTPRGFVVRGAAPTGAQAQGGFRAGADTVTQADEQFADQTRADQMPFYDPRKMLMNLKRGPGVF